LSDPAIALKWPTQAIAALSKERIDYGDRRRSRSEIGLMRKQGSNFAIVNFSIASLEAASKRREVIERRVYRAGMMNRCAEGGYPRQDAFRLVDHPTRHKSNSRDVRHRLIVIDSTLPVSSRRQTPFVTDSALTLQEAS
jgi:hypothetical protein